MYRWSPLPLIYREEGDIPFTFSHSYYSHVKDVTRGRRLVFISLLLLLFYSLSLSLGVSRVSWSFLEHIEYEG